ncbi:MAG: hypothetical protein EOO29_18745, partial [Comamonadaceae bacterium]
MGRLMGECSARVANARHQRLRTAIDQTLNVDKVRTGDLGGSANTAAFTQALVARIRNAG